MSIAGIAKEVTTITISAWFFGDELTPLNVTGVGITVCGAEIVASRSAQLPPFLINPYSRHCFVYIPQVLQIDRLACATGRARQSG